MQGTVAGGGARALGVLALACLLLPVPAPPVCAQGWLSPRASIGETLDLIGRFDTNGDRRLDDIERKSARDWMHAYGITLGAGYRSAPSPASTLAEDVRASAGRAAPVGSALYDESILRTLYLRFASADWYQELADFYGTGVEVPADLVVDGRIYRSAGVRFRGNSSYLMSGSSPKKSMNVSLDYLDSKQRLLGFRTLNLLNANADPTLMREVLFSRIAGCYIPAPRACFVRLMVNGEDWGVYVNVEQFNKDFCRDWFGTTDGARWKVPAGHGSSSGSLAYLGPEVAAYRGSYDIQSSDDPTSWRELIRLCEALARDVGKEGEQELGRILDVDGALWALALENVFIDCDGYLSRAADYLLYEDIRGRFHVIPYDNNETFRPAEGGGPNSWPVRGLALDPLVFERDPARPLVSSLLAVPALRARYLSCVKTLVEEWLSWDALGPLVAAYRGLIGDAVRADDKKLASYDAFLAGTAQETGGEESAGWGPWGAAPSLRRFVEERRAYLLHNPEVARAPTRTRAPAYLEPPRADASSAVLINELMARNTMTVRDPQRQHDDWIELYNGSDAVVDLGGMYLTDDEREPRKWRIPAGVTIRAGGYLLVWADEDLGARPGLHAGFKLSADGETLMLVDADARGNRILDTVRFGPQEADSAIGRYPDGAGLMREVRATPGKANAPR